MERVYLGEEGEFDGVADVGFDVVGHECEGAIADFNGDGSSCCDSRRSSGNESG